MPELPLLSPTDVSKTTEGWTCEPLTVESLLVEGEHFIYYISRVLRYLDLLP